MKKYIVFLILTAFLILIIQWFFSDFYSEQIAKKNYREAKVKIENNWKEKRYEIVTLLKHNRPFPFSGEIQIEKDSLVSIQITNKSLEEGFFKEINRYKEENKKEYLDFVLELDSINQRIWYTGSMNDSDFNFVISLLNKSKNDFIKILSDLEKANCYIISWNQNSIKTVYYGHPFSGAFQYAYYFKSEAYGRFVYKLENDIYWEFYESGLYCSMPPFIPN